MQRETAYERLILTLEQRGSIVRTRGHGVASAQCPCPAHDDKEPSLALRAIEGQALMYCHGGCATEDVLAALGWTMGDLYDNRRGANYRYDNGRVVHRWYSDGKRKFRQSGDLSKVELYHLAKLQAATDATVYLVEGEKDVHAIEDIGGIATTAPQGAKNFSKVDVSPLFGRHVTAVVDRDDSGDKWALRVAAALAEKAAELKFVQARAGKDAADHIAAGYDLTDFVARDDQKAGRDDTDTAENAPLAGKFGNKLLALVGGGYECPAGYRVDHSGVWAVRPVKDGGETLSRVTWAPLMITRVYEDPEGDQSVELAWMDRSRVVRRTVPRSVARRGRLLVATLGDAGLPVIEADAKHVERWLAAVESVNDRAIPRVALARQLGWQDDGTFVTSQDAPLHVEVKFDEQRAALAAHGPSGTLDGWQAAVKPMENYPVAQMGLYAGLAAPLLTPLGINSYTVDISGRSTRGKTTTAMVGMSLWGDPSEKADGLYSWRTSAYAAELRLNLANGLLVVFDETKLVKDPELVNALIYQIPKNHGQPRGGGWASGLPWRTVVISTGEQSVLTFTSDQGAAARVLTLTGAPFGVEGGESAAAANAVQDGCAEHYGVAGPAFVAKLQEGLARPGGKDKLIVKHRELAEQHRGENDISARRAPMLASMVLAAELGHKWGIVPFPPPKLATWTELFTPLDQSDDRGEKALDVVREYIASHSEELWVPKSTTPPPATGWIGRYVAIENTETVAIFPERLRSVLERAKHDLDAVVPAWREAEKLIENRSYRPPYLIKKKIRGVESKFYIFSPDVFATGSDDD